jgi:hypothetical protein
VGQVDRLIPILECFVPYTRKYAVSVHFCVVRPTEKGRVEVEVQYKRGRLLVLPKMAGMNARTMNFNQYFVLDSI